jgi:hypothetical protein
LFRWDRDFGHTLRIILSLSRRRISTATATWTSPSPVIGSATYHGIDAGRPWRPKPIVTITSPASGALIPDDCGLCRSTATAAVVQQHRSSSLYYRNGTNSVVLASTNAPFRCAKSPPARLYGGHLRLCKRRPWIAPATSVGRRRSRLPSGSQTKHHRGSGPHLDLQQSARWPVVERPGYCVWPQDLNGDGHHGFGGGRLMDYYESTSFLCRRVRYGKRLEPDRLDQQRRRRSFPRATTTFEVGLPPNIGGPAEPSLCRRRRSQRRRQTWSWSAVEGLSTLTMSILTNSGNGVFEQATLRPSYDTNDASANGEGPIFCRRLRTSMGTASRISSAVPTTIPGFLNLTVLDEWRATFSFRIQRRASCRAFRAELGRGGGRQWGREH